MKTNKKIKMEEAEYRYFADIFDGGKWYPINPSCCSVKEAVNFKLRLGLKVEKRINNKWVPIINNI